MILLPLPFLSPHRYEFYLYNWKAKKQGFMSRLEFWFCKLMFFIFSPYFDLCLYCLLLNKGYYCLFHVLFLFPPEHKVCMHLSIKCNYITKKISPLPSSSSSSLRFIHQTWWCHMVWDPPLVIWGHLCWPCLLPAPYTAPVCSQVGWGKRKDLVPVQELLSNN